MQIGQNGPLEKFTRLLFMHFRASCTIMYSEITMRYKFMQLVLDTHKIRTSVAPICFFFTDIPIC